MCKHKRISLRDASVSRILATKRADHARLYFVHRYYPERAGRFSHCQDYRFQLRIRSWIVYIHAHEYGADVRGSRSEQGSEESQTRVLQTFSPEVEGFMEGKSNYFFRKIILHFCKQKWNGPDFNSLSLHSFFSPFSHTLSLFLSLSPLSFLVITKGMNRARKLGWKGSKYMKRI